MKMSVFKKMFIALNFLSLKTPSSFSLQDASKHISGDIESQFENLTQVMVKNLDLGSNFQNDFSGSPDTYFDAS